MSKMKSSVIFIRHGESLGNVDSRYYQYSDSAVILSQKGVDQALELKRTIREHLDPDHYGIHTQVITSHMTRAKLTAEIVMAGINLKLPVLHDARLNEVYHSSHLVVNEDASEVRARVRSLIEQYPFNLVLFCHGMLMGCIDPAKGGAQNCEVRKYDRNLLLQQL